MRAPPAVSVRVGGGPGWLGAHLALAALAGAVVAAWACLHAGLAAAMTSALTLGAAALAAALVRWRWPAWSGAGAELRFDGRTWTLDDAAGWPEVALDLQRWLLLRWRGELAARRQRRWIAVSAADAGPALHALRVALYAPPPAAGAAADAGAAPAAPHR